MKQPTTRDLDMTNTTTIGWPYTAGSCLIDPDTARSIRAWALQEMTEAELHSLSQRQLMQMHLRKLEARLAKAWPDRADPETKQWAAERAAAMLNGKPVKDILWEAAASLSEAVDAR
jgi:hypothetical protein